MKPTLLILLACCSPRIIRVPVSTTQDVRIVALPQRPTCWLAEMPEAPADIELNFDDDDIIRRTTVTIRQHNELLQWARDVGHWMGSVKECFYAIQGSEP